ncbi:hypothetical protein ABVT42_19325 [Aliikangiella sp. GXAS 306]|uniref:Uncharacterized protein n=1 Tax=Aliikangiella maris TaxID=3162458 RepID=A0ABV3MTV7_9GAMM
MARKINVTGIKGLSIGRTKNDRGYELSRYCVTKPSPKSFYFGKNKRQYDAYLIACEYLIENGLLNSTKKHLKKIYIEYRHEYLIE